MSDPRILGEDVQIMLVANGEPQELLTDVRSMEIAQVVETLREGYLGETNDRYDDIYRGVRGRMELHFGNEGIFTLWDTIIKRATRKEPGLKINVKATLNFPNGTRRVVLIPDVKFGELPMTFGGRAEYGTVTVEFQAELAQALAV